MSRGRVLTGLLALLACASPAGPRQLHLAAGDYPLGSGPDQREWAYRRSPPGVRSQGWYDAWEQAPHRVRLPGLWIDETPVTQAQYQVFVRSTGHRAPGIRPRAYQRQGFLAHSYAEVVPYLWQGGVPPSDRLDHPVVLVDWEDAAAYCAWRSMRLPSEDEWEAACRGPEGRWLPWGDDWEPGRAQSGASGTAAVGAHPLGATPEGVQDLVGNVFEWTATPFGAGRMVLKGCSWDDVPGTCRCAFRHGRPARSRHILIGFRCVRDP